MNLLDLVDGLNVASSDPWPEDINSGRPILTGAAFWGAHYSDDTGTRIDMMLLHPLHGEIQITLTEADYPQLWSEVVGSGDVAPYVPPTEEERRAEFRSTAVMTRTNFCTALRSAGILNRAEAIAAAKGDWPASFEPMLEGMTEDEADAALILWAGITVIERSHPLLESVRQFKGLSQEAVDSLFGFNP